MPRNILLNGKTYNFPDDATDAEIKEALSSPPSFVSEELPNDPSSIRKIDNGIIEKAMYEQSLKDQKLNTRDRTMYLQLFTPAHEYLAREREDLTPANLASLEDALGKAKDPKIRKVLEEEHARFLKSAQNLLGKVK